MIVELAVHILFFGLTYCNSVLRMTVQYTGNHLRDDVAPFVLGLEREEQFLVSVENRTDIVLGVLQEAEEKFGSAVASATTHAGHRTIKEVHVVDDGLDGVGESHCWLL